MAFNLKDPFGRTGRLPAHHQRGLYVKMITCLLVNHCSKTLLTSYINCPPMKLRESNVFSRVCPTVSHSVLSSGDMGPLHDALDMNVHGPFFLQKCNFTAQVPQPTPPSHEISLDMEPG